MKMDCYPSPKDAHVGSNSTSQLAHARTRPATIVGGCRWGMGQKKKSSKSDCQAVLLLG